jgi:hypothetical protein
MLQQLNWCFVQMLDLSLDYDTVSFYVVTVDCSDHRRSGNTENLTVNLIRNTVCISRFRDTKY